MEFNIDLTSNNTESLINEYWKNNNIYEKIQTRKLKIYYFLDGPIFTNINGSLHLGHALQSYIKSSQFHYKSMNNYYFQNMIGQDNHGSPIQQYMNEKLNLHSFEEITNYGLKRFNDECNIAIDNVVNTHWKEFFELNGRMLNMDYNYKTRDLNYMESVWWSFKQLYEKNLIYYGYKILSFSYTCRCSWSKSELEYKSINTKSIYVVIPLLNDSNLNIIIWTTTPYTLLTNTHICVNPNAKYVKVYDKKTNKWYIVSDKCVNNLQFEDPIIEYYKMGHEMIGEKYIPLFDDLQHIHNDHHIICDDYVLDNEIGTGCVHINPCHGEDDYNVVIKNNLLTYEQIKNLCIVNDDGTYKSGKYIGKLIFDADEFIINDLKHEEKIIRIQTITHDYPHCWRTDTKLFFKISPSYFVAVTQIKEKLLENNKKINWNPEWVGKKYEHWINNINDWSISRNHIFGTPIPIFTDENFTETICIGSIDELMELCELTERPTNIHTDFVWNLRIVSKTTGNILYPIKSCLDCWYESGASTFAQYHYPFENREYIDDKELYINDYVVEGLDQYKLWFNYLLILSTMLFDKIPYKNVNITGMILDKNGNKFSKRLKNYCDAMELVKKYGSDYIRLYFLSSPLLRAEPLYFDENNINKTKKKIIPYINAIKLLLEHIQTYESHGNEFIINLDTNNILDIWIISKIRKLLDDVVNSMDNYKIDDATNHVIGFINELTNWYIRLNRDRLKGKKEEAEQIQSLNILLFVVLNYCIISAPFMPFLSEYIFQRIKIYYINFRNIESVFLCNYPNITEFIFNNDIITSVLRIQDLIQIIRRLRQDTKFASNKVPLSKIIIAHANNNFINDIKQFHNLLLKEANCFEIEYNDNYDIIYNVKQNFKTFGKKFKTNTQIVKNKLIGIPQEILKQFYNDEINSYELDEFMIEKNDIIIEAQPTLVCENYKIYYTNELFVGIDKTYNDNIKNTHMLKLLVNNTQKIRKNNGLHLWDKIIIKYDTNAEFKNIIMNNHEFLEKELLCPVMGFYDGKCTKIIEENISIIDNSINVNIFIL